MPEFASRSPRRDAARRVFPFFPALRLWAFPVALIACWLAAGAFSLSALESATAAWRARPPLRPAVVEQIEVKSPALPIRRVSRAKEAGVRVPGCPQAGRDRRALKEASAFHPG